VNVGLVVLDVVECVAAEKVVIVVPVGWFVVTDDVSFPPDAEGFWLVPGDDVVEGVVVPEKQYVLAFIKI